MIKKVIGMILCIVLSASCLAIFSSCKKDEKVPEESDVVTTVTQGSEGGYQYVAPDVNYDGKEFNICTWDFANQLGNDWILELEASGDSQASNIDTQTFYHLKNVENELGIKFNIAISTPGAYYQRGDFIAKIQMLSGDDKIDLICQYSLAASNGTQEGLYVDIANAKYINWDAPYWSQSLRQANTINNKMYYCTGDLSGSVLKNMILIVFNHTMISDNNFGNLYEMVENKEWTIDRLKEISATIYSDDNGSEISDKGDTFGFVMGDYTLVDAFQYGADLPCLITNSLGEIEVNPQLYGDKGVNVCEKLIDLMKTNPGAYCHTKEREGNTEAFYTGKAAFQPYIAGVLIDKLSSVDIDYGILPIPMFDENQEQYYTALSMMYNMFSIPLVARDPDMSSAVLESMAHDGYVNLNPVIFEALQYRYSNRPEDSKMLEILRDGIVYDSGRILDTVDIFSLVRRTVRDSASLKVYYEKDKNRFKKGISEVNFMFS